MAEKLRKRGRNWYYRFTDANGKRVMVKGCADRRETERMAAAAEIEAAKVRSDLADPKALAYRDHEARPLTRHIDAWQDDLIAQGATAKHAEHTSNRARRLVAVILGSADALKDHRRLAPKERGDVARNIADAIEPARLSDLAREAVQDAISRLRDAGWSLQTCNHYRASLKAFSKWCHDSHRVREDDLRGVKAYNVKEDRRHDRRTVSLEELQRLIAVTEQGIEVMGMTGPTRALCYRLAVATGLRYAEIGSILPGSFDWGAPSVTVKAAYTKNGDPAVMPLPRELADDLAAYTELRPRALQVVDDLPRELADDLAAYVVPVPPDEPVFPLPDEKGAKMLRVDLEAAGIDYQDASGLFFDFHSLRCEMATLADAAGVTPRVVQTMMRHSSLELTGRYPNRAVNVESAAFMIPSLKTERDRPESMAATGTDGAPISKLLLLPCAIPGTHPVVACRTLTRPRILGPDRRWSEVPWKP